MGKLIAPAILVLALVAFFAWNSWIMWHESAFACDVSGKLWLLNDNGHVLRYPERVKGTPWCKPSSELYIETFPGRPTWLLQPDPSREKWDATVPDDVSLTNRSRLHQP